MRERPKISHMSVGTNTTSPTVSTFGDDLMSRVREQYDREVKVDALREAADEIDRQLAEHDRRGGNLRAWWSVRALRDIADRIEADDE